MPYLYVPKYGKIHIGLRKGWRSNCANPNTRIVELVISKYDET